MLSFSIEDGPGIDGFQIIRDAKPGGKLLGRGFPVRGTSVCMFQVKEHYTFQFSAKVYFKSKRD